MIDVLIDLCIYYYNTGIENPYKTRGYSYQTPYMEGSYLSDLVSLRWGCSKKVNPPTTLCVNKLQGGRIVNNIIKPRTVKLISKLLAPWTDEGVVSVPEKREIIFQLRYLADTGERQPIVIPKLIDQKEAAQMLGIGLSNFKKLEKSGELPIKRKMVGTSVRYRNTDVVKFLMND